MVLLILLLLNLPIVPILESNEDYKFMTVWLIKTKQVIDTSGTSTKPGI